MQQKIQLAGTLIHEPELLVLDEPFSGLDPINQGLFKDLLAAHKAAGKTLLFSTHVMEQAEKLCDHIALIAARPRGPRPASSRRSSARRGADRYRLVAEGDLERPPSMPGVAAVREPQRLPRGDRRRPAPTRAECCASWSRSCRPRVPLRRADARGDLRQGGARCRL